MPPLGQFKYRGRSPKPDDPELIAVIENCQRTGMSHRVTASVAEISKDTLTNWLNLGRSELAAWDKANQTWEELGSLGRFAARFERAAAEFEAGNTADIIASIHDKSVNFVPALILNKARNPADWLEARQVNVQQDVRVLTVSVSLPALATQQLLAIAQRELAQQALLEAHSSEEIEPDGVIDVDTTTTDL